MLVVFILFLAAKIFFINQNYNNKYYTFGVDIGGTKIDCQLFSIENSFLAQKPSWEIKQNTKKGLTKHVNQIAELYALAEEQANKMQGKIIALGIGSPGRFNIIGNIKPGTSPHLGKTLDEFIILT